MSDIAFGTDGWRAIIGEDYTYANLRRVTEAFGRVIPEKCPVVVGYDHRFQSESFADEVGAVLADQGHKVTLFSHAKRMPH